jgi:hypothetical protein
VSAGAGSQAEVLHRGVHIARSERPEAVASALNHAAPIRTRHVSVSTATSSRDPRSARESA